MTLLQCSRWPAKKDTADHPVMTRIVAIAIRMVGREMPGIKLLVSYADLNQGHVGKIYQAGIGFIVGPTGHEAGIMQCQAQKKSIITAALLALLTTSIMTAIDATIIRIGTAVWILTGMGALNDGSATAWILTTMGALNDGNTTGWIVTVMDTSSAGS